MQLLKVLRMAALAVLALVFWTRPQTIMAQGSTCETFSTLQECCSDYSNFCTLPITASMPFRNRPEVDDKQPNGPA